jgi:hypothetical protein
MRYTNLSSIWVICKFSSSRMTLWCSGIENSFCDGLKFGIIAVPTKPKRWSPLCAGRRWSGCNQRCSPMICIDYLMNEIEKRFVDRKISYSIARCFHIGCAFC